MNKQRKWDLRFLRLAKEISSWSKDPSTKVGCVITDGNKIVSLGFNGFPSKINDSKKRLNNRDIKIAMVLHGEENALIFANRSVNGCVCYTWPWSSCAHCSSLLIQHGIKRVVSIDDTPQRWKENVALGQEILKEAKVKVKLYSKGDFNDYRR